MTSYFVFGSFLFDEEHFHPEDHKRCSGREMATDTNRQMLPYETLRLHISPTHFYLEPIETNVRELVTIDRVSREILLTKKENQIPSGSEVKSIHGILGIIHLLAGPYLIVITNRTKVGTVDEKTIWKITGTEIIPYQRTLLHLNEQQVQDNGRYLSMVESVLASDSFYFSVAFDLTHTMQRLFNTSPDFKQIPLHERADARFVWNGFVLRDLSQQSELSRFCIPVMLGFVLVNQCELKGQAFKYILLSRRSCFRAGTRYYMRGIDTEGHVANFVETEQIIEFSGIKCSFVQTRGSVPLHWSQFPDLSYKPRPVISASHNHLDGFQRHFATQVFHYGKQVLVNLLDQKGSELKLVDGYGQMVKNLNNNQIRYEPFDFHKECRKMQWHRLSVLTDRVAEDLKSFGYFMIHDSSVVSLQTGIFRTNCIDCLDRTNVVQSLLAKKSLLDQFSKLGILAVGEDFDSYPSFASVFKNVWADNADVCAKQYAGTGALKTDFTRTGKRTVLGALKDGYNSLIRYFLNNFYDGYRQDAMDLLLGNYEVEDTEGQTKPSPLRQERDWKFYALPAIFVVAFSMCIISILIPDEHPSEQAMYVLFWGGASVITLGCIYYYGQEFVDRPKLVQGKLKTE